MPVSPTHFLVVQRCWCVWGGGKGGAAAVVPLFGGGGHHHHHHHASPPIIITNKQHQRNGPREKSAPSHHVWVARAWCTTLLLLNSSLVMLSHGIGLYLALARYALKSLKLSPEEGRRTFCPPLPRGLACGLPHSWRCFSMRMCLSMHSSFLWCVCTHPKRAASPGS